ncbi:hypothetical protein EJ06DRAFT_430175 [Trichodelitschia bisporula]|uniref:Jacalin-type lectin domain-containing protein n=1 Tax=Trichodelitschia bisporula TaxID=703511 RepID=A0A6G1HWP7_9PEZI|nr:hypothetical protein EJ06DRAFT_430175 [Trichodelitschia bisporula]
MIIPERSAAAPVQIILGNVEDDEVIFQRCLLLTGRCENLADDASDPSSTYILVRTLSSEGAELFPDQTWPLARGYFKALLFLSPGENTISLTLHTSSGVLSTTTLTLTYFPPLHAPPLQLAILVASDSPLLIDCPSTKSAGLCNAHSDLAAAIAKFRMTAYMWQAMTAEDMRQKGLGRRSFHLEEEWLPDTVSRTFVNKAAHGDLASREGGGVMRSTAKVNLVTATQTVRELRDPDVAQQNENGTRRDQLHSWFTDALAQAGGSLGLDARPVVAGLILDSHYDANSGLILAHAALGCRNDNGISLGVFGSHLTYSWPRFLEEVVPSLTDGRAPGTGVGNDAGDCLSMWEACCVGQGAFLHEAGHAFGSPHRSGIMERGYPVHWARNFLSSTSPSQARNEPGIPVVTADTPNDARWHILDALSFKYHMHFRQPMDPLYDSSVLSKMPDVKVMYANTGPYLQMSCEPLGLAIVEFQGTETLSDWKNPCKSCDWQLHELESMWSRDQALNVRVVGMNGVEKTLSNVWQLFPTGAVKVTGTDVLIGKASVASQELATRDDIPLWRWAVLFKQRTSSGGRRSLPNWAARNSVTDELVVSATSIDCRVGALLDGAVVGFQDGHKVPCGPRWDRDGHQHHFGGHRSEERSFAATTNITMIEVSAANGGLDALRVHSSDGQTWGCLSEQEQSETTSLEAGPPDRIIGFFGCNEYSNGSYFRTMEFGILTLNKDVDIPDQAFDMEELRNTDGGCGERPNGDHEDGNEWV